MSSVVQATALWGYRDVVHQLGGDPDAFLTRFGIPLGADRGDEDFISFPAFAKMLEATADELDCPELGLRLSRWQGVDVLGPVAVVARNARTVGSGIDEVARYLYIHSPAMRLARVRLPDETGYGIAFEVTEPGLTSVIQLHELGMAVAARILRLLAGPDAVPDIVVFPHARQGSDDAYREALGCPVQFGRNRCGFLLSAELATRPISGADTATRRIARKYLDAQYIPPSASLADRVASLAHALLPTGRCSVAAIAGAMALPPRTLQRHLAAESTSCQAVIERERRHLVARYLATPGIQLSRIASLVGYTEQSALNRSCRRWFGMTPRQYRASLDESALER